MGLCQDKDCYIVCSFDISGYEDHGKCKSPRRVLRGSEVTEPLMSVETTPPPRKKRIPSLVNMPTPPQRSEERVKKVNFQTNEDDDVAAQTKKALEPPESSRLARFDSVAMEKAMEFSVVPGRSLRCITPEVRDSAPSLGSSHASDLAPPVLNEPLHLTAESLNWATDLAESRLEEVRCHVEGSLRLKLCVRLISETFSFQVISAVRQWAWRLYPRKGTNPQSAVSKSSVLVPNSPDAVSVASGSRSKEADGMQFHVVESEGAIVTVWVEVPVLTAADGTLDLSASPGAAALGFRVWYTNEDTGVRLEAGDGVHLSKWHRWSLARR